MTHRYAPRLAALAGLATCLALIAVGSSTLPPPPADPGALPSWWASTDAALALGSLLRLVAAVLCGWLLLVTAAELVATLAGRARAAHALGRLAPAAWRALVLRPVVAGALALPVLASPVSILSPAVAGASTAAVDDAAVESTDASPAILTMTLRPPTDGPREVDEAVEPAPDSPTTTITTTTVVPPPEPTTTTAPASVPPTSTPPTLPWTAHPEDLHDHTDPPPPSTADEHAPEPIQNVHVVASGESFWSIATARVDAHLGRAPTEREVAAYWVALVELNEDRLPVPGNPDLLFPGDEVLLPPV